MATASYRKITELSPMQRQALLNQLREKSDESLKPETPVDRPVGPSEARTNVVILGGGVAGLTLALQLKATDAELSIKVVERSQYPVPQAAHKVGESTVEIAAHYLRDILGLGDHLETEQIRKFGLRMFFGDGNNNDIASRRELGSSEFPPLATYQLDRGRLENELVCRCQESGVELVTARVLDVEIAGDNSAHRIQLAGQSGPLLADWVVDASGRSQVLRRKLGHDGQENGHRANAAWFRIDLPIDVTTWSDDQHWRGRIKHGDRSKSTIHLMGDGYWVWLIRLAGGVTSVGIVADAERHDFSSFNTFDRALEWLAKREPQCAGVVSENRSKILDFRVMRDYSYLCEQVFSGTDRWGLTGESGIFLDPLYSPGLDQIAISNSLLVDLIIRSLAGEDVTSLAAAHSKLYLDMAKIWLAIYREQYPLMSNPTVMSAKVIWDTAFYWAVFGFLFFHGQFRNVGQDPGMVRDLERLTVISNRVQELFREWAKIEIGHTAGDFVDLYSPLNFMVDLHHAMAEDCGPDSAQRLAMNRTTLEQLAGQLVETIIREHADDTDDVTIAALQRWQRDPIIAGFRRVYRAHRAQSPTADGWIRTSVQSEMRGAAHEVEVA